MFLFSRPAVFHGPKTPARPAKILSGAGQCLFAPVLLFQKLCFQPFLPMPRFPLLPVAPFFAFLPQASRPVAAPTPAGYSNRTASRPATNRLPTALKSIYCCPYVLLINDFKQKNPSNVVSC